MMKFDLPHNISYQTKKVDLPFKVAKKASANSPTYKGVISKEGKWILPIGAWKVSLKAPGTYIIEHMTGFKYMSVSVDTMGAQGVINIINLNEYNLEILITDGKDPIEIDFAICFTQTKVLAG